MLEFILIDTFCQMPNESLVNEEKNKCFVKVDP